MIYTITIDDAVAALVEKILGIPVDALTETDELIALRAEFDALWVGEPIKRGGTTVADEEERLGERERQRREEHDEEDVEHALLRVLGADLDDLLRVFHRRFRGAFELDVRLGRFGAGVVEGQPALGGALAQRRDEAPLALVTRVGQVGVKGVELAL